MVVGHVERDGGQIGAVAETVDDRFGIARSGDDRIP
jgi:hypothetical protein